MEAVYSDSISVDLPDPIQAEQTEPFETADSDEPADGENDELLAADDSDEN